MSYTTYDMHPTKSRTRPKRKAIALIVLLFWFAVLGLAAYNRQNLQDWWHLRGYTAPSAVASMATQDTMTDYARKVLYVNHPLLEDKTAFTQCNQQSEKTIVLGCYHSNQNGIFVLTVADSRLNGVEQVTTAHEMLHAAYDRLSTSDRNYVDGLLEDYYQHDVHDQRILDTITAYKKSEPDAVVNEMHSIFGTEIAILPPKLEAYYKKYFTNRAAVAEYATKYESEFTSRLATIKADDMQLASLKQQINGLKTSLSSQNSALNAQQSQLEAYRSGGNISAYNSAVPTYNAAVNAYNASVGQAKSLIAQYNQLVDNRNSLAAETQQLQAAIQGQPETISR